MSSRELTRQTSHWIRAYGFNPLVSTKRFKDHYSVEFAARTTKTRASSIVTRLQLMSNDLGHGASVIKELMGEPPRDRASLCSWKISVLIPVNRRQEAA